MKLETLKDLFIEQLKDLYSAEKQLTKALPKMAKNATNSNLKKAFESHLKETEQHVTRIEKIFEHLDRKPGGHKCKAMEGLIEEGEELLKEDGDPNVKDAGLIAAAQRVEHYEIAAYGTARAFANFIGDKEAIKLLDDTLKEEKAADSKLTDIAMNAVNAKAEKPAMA